MAELPADALTLVEIPALAISSTDCRRRAAQNHPIWYLVPDGVVQYVSKRRLYGAGTDPGTDKGLPDGSSLAKITNQETQ
jgi:nicotinate-nucleotide adenylyltransferase